VAAASLNRIQNDLRAALKAAIETHGRELPATLRYDVTTGLRSLPDAEQARKIVLKDDQVRKVICASQTTDDDLGAMVLVLASTGCRFSQAAALLVGDLQIDTRRIIVPSSRKGRGTKPVSAPLLPGTCTVRPGQSAQEQGRLGMCNSSKATLQKCNLTGRLTRSSVDWFLCIIRTRLTLFASWQAMFVMEV
jgi:integrase